MSLTMESISHTLINERKVDPSIAQRIAMEIELAYYSRFNEEFVKANATMLGQIFAEVTKNSPELEDNALIHFYCNKLDITNEKLKNKVIYLYRIQVGQPNRNCYPDLTDNQDNIDVLKLLNFLKDRFRLTTIDYKPAFWAGNCYQNNENDLDELIKLVGTVYNKRITPSLRKELLSYISYKFSSERISPNYIPFKNGILKLLEDRLDDKDLKFSAQFIQKPTPDYVVTNSLKIDYNPDAKSKKMDKLLADWSDHDQDIRANIEEMIGAVLYMGGNLKLCFALYGNTNSGKTTFLKVLKKILGKGNYSDFTLFQVADRFNKIMLSGKRAIFGDETPDEKLSSSQEAFLKNITSNGEISAEHKGKDVEEVIIRATYLFACNSIPEISDPITRKRIRVIPFLNSFGIGPALDKMLTEEDLQYLVNLGLIGLKRMLLRKRRGEIFICTPSSTIDELESDLAYESNTTNAYCDNVLKDEPSRIVFIQKGTNLEQRTTKAIFCEYKLYCAQNHLSLDCKATFLRIITDRYNLIVKTIHYTKSNGEATTGNFFLRT